MLTQSKDLVDPGLKLCYLDRTVGGIEGPAGTRKAGRRQVAERLSCTATPAISIPNERIVRIIERMEVLVGGERMKHEIGIRDLGKRGHAKPRGDGQIQEKKYLSRVLAATQGSATCTVRRFGSQRFKDWQRI